MAFLETEQSLQLKNYIEFLQYSSRILFDFVQRSVYAHTNIEYQIYGHVKIINILRISHESLEILLFEKIVKLW